MARSLVFALAALTGCTSGAKAERVEDAGRRPVLRYTYGCGDVVCSGHRPQPGVRSCTSESPGAVCAEEGARCDPADPCNRLLRCEADQGKQDCPVSRRASKQDIHYLDASERLALHGELAKLRLATWRYLGESRAPRLGFIIEDVEPSASVDSERGVVDLYGYTSLAVAAIQVQQQQIDALRREVEQLRAQLEDRAAGRGPAARLDRPDDVIP